MRHEKQKKLTVFYLYSFSILELLEMSIIYIDTSII
ncbi:hypothetical protein PT2222_120116 [Paraburkholderia tropica]